MRLVLERRSRVPRVPGWTTAVVVIWLSAVAALALLARAVGSPPVPCHFRAMTGVPCATCGSTRAGMAVFDGRLTDALLLNPLMVVATVAAMAILGVRFITARQVVLAMSRRERMGAWIVAAAAFAVHWAYVIASHAAEAGGP